MSTKAKATITTQAQNPEKRSHMSQKTTTMAAEIGHDKLSAPSDFINYHLVCHFIAGRETLPAPKLLRPAICKKFLARTITAERCHIL